MGVILPLGACTQQSIIRGGSAPRSNPLPRVHPYITYTAMCRLTEAEAFSRTGYDDDDDDDDDDELYS